MFQVHITDVAENDIQETYDWWWQNRSTGEAERWMDSIYPAIARLKEMPKRCAIAPESEHCVIELRQLIFGIGSKATHRIVFTIKENSVYILRVRHLSQQHLYA